MVCISGWSSCLQYGAHLSASLTILSAQFWTIQAGSLQIDVKDGIRNAPLAPKLISEADWSHCWG